MAKFTKSVMNTRSKKFFSNAAITDGEFSTLCKDFLTYVYDDFAEVNNCNDVASINNFIAGLKPAYKRMAKEFFPKFVGWDWDSTEEVFKTKHAKKKNYDSKKAKAKAFYESADSINDWVEANVKKAEKKPTDYKKAVGNALKKAFAAKDEEGKAAFTMKDLVNVMRAEDIDMRQLMELAELAVKFDEA